jgi:hypothetical protein
VTPAQGGVRSVADKMRLKPGWRTYFHHAPPAVLESMGLPALEVVDRLCGEFYYLHLFVRTKDDLSRELARLRPHLADSGKLWISWPKRHQLDSDLTLPAVIAIGYRVGLVESTCLRIDDVWAALRFTVPKPGRAYNNSYGTLPDGQALDNDAR